MLPGIRYGVKNGYPPGTVAETTVSGGDDGMDMTKDPWLKFGILGGIGFIAGWAVPEYLFKNEITLIPVAGGLMFFAAALIMRSYLRKKKD